MVEPIQKVEVEFQSGAVQMQVCPNCGRDNVLSDAEVLRGERRCRFCSETFKVLRQSIQRPYQTVTYERESVRIDNWKIRWAFFAFGLTVGTIGAALCWAVWS